MARARPYHKRWHGNALNGMRGLSLEERGAYNTLLDLMYDRQGAWPDDERRTCGELDCDPRVWRRVKTALVEKGKIVVHAGLIYARRVHEELGTSAELPAEVREKFAIATRQLTPTSDEKPKENRQTSEEKNGKADLLFQSPESITPKAPKGASVRQQDVDGIWDIAPEVSRKRSGKAPLRKALEAVAKQGHPPSVVCRGLRGYFASDEAARDGGKFVAGVHRLVSGGRWEAFADSPEPEPPLLAVAAVEDPWVRRVREFAKNSCWNELDWGPRPGRPGCTVDPTIQREFGIEPAKPQPVRGAA